MTPAAQPPAAPEPMYEYKTPDGYEDIFFIYVFDAGSTGANLTDGDDYTSLQITVTDGAFVCRAWNGAYTVLSQTAGDLGKIEVYGQNIDKWFDTPTNCYTLNQQGQCSTPPGAIEKVYGNNTAIRFDLLNVKIRML